MSEKVMQIIKRKLRGVTLFEVLLFMFVASLITVAGVRYMRHQSEVSSDQDYGTKLYILGQAVSSYVTQATQLTVTGNLPGPGGVNPAQVTVTQNGTSTTIQVVGVDWLKKNNAGVNPITKNPYLPDSFSFSTGLDLLYVDIPDEAGLPTGKKGNQAIVTEISFDKTQPSLPPLIKITAGVLFGIPNPAATPVKVDLTNDAVQHANTIYDPALGAALIQYSYVYYDLNTQTPNPKAQVTGSSFGKMSEYLKTDGGNKMRGNLGFVVGALGMSQGKILNPQDIVFSTMPAGAGNTTSITGLNTLSMSKNTTTDTAAILEFATGGSINDPRNVVFDRTIESVLEKMKKITFVGGSTIENLRTLGFDGSNTSNIKNLQTIKFIKPPSDPFVGISYPAYYTCTGNSRCELGNYDYCMLSQVKFKTTSNSHRGGCNLFPFAIQLGFTSSVPPFWSIQPGDAVTTCSAYCFNYKQ